MMRVSPAALHASVPAGWSQIAPEWRLDLDWSHLLPSVNARMASDGYVMFGAFFLMMVFKGVLVSGAGPAPNYDMQRILAAKSPREASLMSAFVSIVLFLPRYFMIAGIAVLALVFLRPAVAAQQLDFEQILPLVIRDFVPAGLAGLLIAGFLAAFMSTFAGTINAAAAYIVNDLYKRYRRPDAPERTYVRASYVAQIAVVIVGCALGAYATSINTITLWIVAALWGGYAAPNLLKWHWWRLNGWGYFFGMVGGIAGALVLAAFPQIRPLYAFPVLLLISGAAAIIGSLATAPQDEGTLLSFYSRTRPWGFWRPVRRRSFAVPGRFGRDAFNVLVGIAWQTGLVALPIYVVIRDLRGALASLAVIVLGTLVLRWTWWGQAEEETACVSAISTTSDASM
jgi:hypothetical protein